MKNKMAKVGAITLGFLCLAAIFAPWLSPFSFDAQDVNHVLVLPNSTNFFGTDELGRDLFSRVLFGARVSLSIGIMTATFAIVIGVIYGAISGYKGGVVDALMMRFTDVILAIP